MVTDCVVLGGADCVWNDYREFLEMRIPAKVIATNDAGAHFDGKLDYWVTLHPENLGNWRRLRAQEDYTAYTRRLSHGCGEVTLVNDIWLGSSGLYAVQIALLNLNAERVFLCGAPMTATPHFFDDKPWTDGEYYRKGWRQAETDMRGKVKSFSGWTRELLGHPSEFLGALTNAN